MHQPRVGDLAWLSAAALELLRALQRQPAACAHIDQARDGWRAETLVHADLRWTTSSSGPSPPGRSCSWFDWESAGLGDSAWDVGCVLAQLLSDWIVSMPVSGGESATLVASAARRDLSSLHGQLGVLDGIRAAAIPAGRRRAARPVAVYAGVRMLQLGIEIAQTRATPNRRSRRPHAGRVRRPGGTLARRRCPARSRPVTGPIAFDELVLEALERFESRARPSLVVRSPLRGGSEGYRLLGAIRTRLYTDFYCRGRATPHAGPDEEIRSARPTGSSTALPGEHRAGGLGPGLARGGSASSGYLRWLRRDGLHRFSAESVRGAHGRGGGRARSATRSGAPERDAGLYLALGDAPEPVSHDLVRFYLGTCTREGGPPLVAAAIAASTPPTSASS